MALLARVALVDQVLLSRCAKLLRSSASSFSDAAVSLGRPGMEVVSPCGGEPNGSLVGGG